LPRVRKLDGLRGDTLRGCSVSVEAHPFHPSSPPCVMER
jgi:hypothetical protein